MRNTAPQHPLQLMADSLNGRRSATRSRVLRPLLLALCLSAACFAAPSVAFAKNILVTGAGGRTGILVVGELLEPLDERTLQVKFFRFKLKRCRYFALGLVAADDACTLFAMGCPCGSNRRSSSSNHSRSSSRSAAVVAVLVVAVVVCSSGSTSE